MISAIVKFIQQHKLLHFLQENLWHIITCHSYVHNLWYPYHIMERTTLHHHCTANNCQEVPHLKKILRHTTTHPNRYHTFQLNLIQTQVHRIILRHNNLTHLTPGIRNKADINVRNSKGKSVTTTLLKSVPSSQPRYLILRTILRSQTSNWKRILYSAGFISRM